MFKTFVSLLSGHASYVLPVAMSLKAILSISHVYDAVFLSLKPNLMQL
jgi:hypothetical protein